MYSYQDDMDTVIVACKAYFVYWQMPWTYAQNLTCKSYHRLRGAASDLYMASKQHYRAFQQSLLMPFLSSSHSIII